MNAIRQTDKYSSCVVCGGAALRGLWEVNGYTIARCGTCHLVFVQDRITGEELAAHYSSGRDDTYDETNIECLNYYYRKLGDKIRDRFPQPGKLLDVGCSRGWFFDVMRDWECHGNEIGVSDALIAQQRHGDRIVIGPFEEYPLRENFFDVITLQDVFDHFRDPMATLEKCWRLLRPGGLIAIKVHNISCLYAKLSGRGFYAIIPPSHLFYYDGKTLDRALSKSGFQVVESAFIGHLLKVETVFSRLSQGNAKSFFYRVFKALHGTALGEIKFHKNLHDIITVLAVKPIGT